MKILVIWRLLTVGGVNAGWRNRAVYFKQHGIMTEFLYTTDHGGLHIMEDVAPVYLTKDETEIVSIIQNNNYDAIIVVDTGAAFKWLQKANYQGPVIVEARTPELIKLTPHLKNFRGIRPVSLIVPSQYQKQLVSILTDANPVNVIYNGVDTTFFRPLTSEEIDHTHDPLLPKDKKVIGWIGRLDKRKNWPLLLEIASWIKNERDDIEFWVIGGAQSVQREEFAAQLEQQQMTDMIKWFPVISYQQMPQIYAKIRQSGGCTLATTRSESFGNTFIEAMACGVPVVAPKIMPIQELVIPGETGLLFRGHQVKSAVKQLYRILENPELHLLLSQNAIHHIEQKFAIPKVAEHYVHVLKNIIKESKMNSNKTVANGEGNLS